MWPRAVFTCSINVSWLTCYKQRWKSERKKVTAVCYRQNTLSHFSDKNKKKRCLEIDNPLIRDCTGTRFT